MEPGGLVRQDKITDQPKSMPEHGPGSLRSSGGGGREHLGGISRVSQGSLMATEQEPGQKTHE